MEYMSNKKKIDYKKYWKEGYKTRSSHFVSDNDRTEDKKIFFFPKDLDKWLECPNCGLKPKVWEFNNGRLTNCGCGRNEYDSFEIEAQNVGYYIRTTKGFRGYEKDELLNNWNHWVRTGDKKKIHTFTKKELEDFKKEITKKE